jgi:hypothetical protein
MNFLRQPSSNPSIFYAKAKNSKIVAHYIAIKIMMDYPKEQNNLF